MGKDWMSEYLQRRQAGRKQKERQAELDSVARSRIPEMFRRLNKQLHEDLTVYKTSPGSASIAWEDRHNGLEIKNERYPTFWLRLEPDAAGINVTQTTRKSSSASNVREERAILIIATGTDELYYRIDGKDFTCESDVSEHLLRPLLELIEE